jgi:hypothetical protein
MNSQPEWLKIAAGPGLWIIGFIFAANAIVQSLLFARLARRVAARLRMSDRGVKEAIRASFVASIGPAMGSFVGMTVLVLALGGAYAFARESAGVGSIMYELLAARNGAQAAGVELTRESMTLEALVVVFWVTAIGSFGWLIVGGVGTRWLPKIKNAIGGGDPRRLQVISVAIMLGAFSRLLTTDGIAPLLNEGRLPPLAASVAGGAAAAATMLYATRTGRTGLREYVIIIALVAGITAGELTRLAIG